MLGRISRDIMASSDNQAGAWVVDQVKCAAEQSATLDPNEVEDNLP